MAHRESKRGRPNIDLTPFADWCALQYIYSCYLYDNDYEYVLDDYSYTATWAMLAGRPPYPEAYWPHLSDHLKERIPYDILDTPSSIGLAQLGWREEDRKGAFEWFNKVHGRDPSKL